MNIRNAFLCLGVGLAATGCAAMDPEEEELQVGPDGELTTDGDEPRDVTERVITELTLPNGSTVTFFQLGDGGIVVREHGQPSANAIGELPELAEASPYEVFMAIAPPGTLAPAELVADQAQVVAQRKAEQQATTVPEGFRVDDIPGFLAPHQQRAFNSCTDVNGWEDHVGGSPIGSNCPGGAGFAFYQCTSNWNPPHVDNCAGVACTEYFLQGYRRARSSVCSRSGDGYIRFLMGIRNHGGAFATWFDHNLYTGGFYYYWYSHSSQEKDFWRLIYRTGTRRANKSLWLKF